VVSVPINASVDFAAAVSGTNNTAVTYSATNAAGEDITGAVFIDTTRPNRFRAPTTPGSITVTARSAADATKTATATVSVIGSEAVVLTATQGSTSVTAPATLNLPVGQQIVLSATPFSQGQPTSVPVERIEVVPASSANVSFSAVTEATAFERRVTVTGVAPGSVAIQMRDKTTGQISAAITVNVQSNTGGTTGVQVQ